MFSFECWLTNKFFPLEPDLFSVGLWLFFMLLVLFKLVSLSEAKKKLGIQVKFFSSISLVYALVVMSCNLKFALMLLSNWSF